MGWGQGWCLRLAPWLVLETNYSAEHSDVVLASAGLGLESHWIVSTSTNDICLNVSVKFPFNVHLKLSCVCHSLLRIDYFVMNAMASDNASQR